MDARVHYADWGFRIAEIGLPIDAFHGDHDRLVPFAFGEHLAAHAPRASLHRIIAKGHLFPAMAEYQRRIFETARSLL